MTLDRRALLMLPVFATLAPRAWAAALSPDDQALVDQAVAYLQGLANAKGRFKQTDSKGGVVTGTLYVARPGRARFEYDPPSGLLMTADGKTVTVSDSRLKTTHRYPLASTPLALLLDKQIQLNSGVRLMSVTHVYDGFSITAADARGQSQGTIRLDFIQTPMRLAGWAITDPQKRQTTVELQGFAATGPFSPDLFSQPDISAQPPG